MPEVLTPQHFDIAGPEQPPALTQTEIGRPTDEILAVENMRLGEFPGPMNPAVEQAVSERMTHTTADVEMIEGATFPINRIVGVEGFQSWAGRGLETTGKVIDHDGASSAHHVYEYAQHEQSRPPRPALRHRTDESPVALSDDFDREDFI